MYYFFKGCWVRAELYSSLILRFLDEKYPNQSFDAPKKHFAFGNLWTKSINAAPGKDEWIYWNYHVAPIVRLNDGKLYVFDPALGGNAIPKEEWYSDMTLKQSSSISGFVTCEANTYSPLNSCFHPTKHTDDEIIIHKIYIYMISMMNVSFSRLSRYAQLIFSP